MTIKVQDEEKIEDINLTIDDIPVVDSYIVVEPNWNVWDTLIASGITLIITGVVVGVGYIFWSAFTFKFFEQY
jgi:hypothetical protein